MQSKNIILLFFLVLFLASCSQQKPIEESLTWETLADILIPRSGGAGGAAIDGKIYVVGGTGSNAGQSLEMYDPATNSWMEKAQMPTRRESPIVVAFENKLYVIGGTNPSAANGDYYDAQTAVVEIYDPATDTWSDSPSLNQKRDVAAGVVVSDKIYVLGGMIGLEEGMTAGSDSKGKPVVNTDTVEVYSPQTNNWTMLDAPMPVATRAMAYATVGKNIYLFGGCAGIVESPCTQTRVQIFDTETETWRLAAEEMPTGRHFSGQGAVAVGTDIYVFGGATDYSEHVFDTVEIFDTVSETWSEATPMKTGRKSTASAFVDGYLYIIGGHTDDTFKLGNSVNERAYVGGE